MNPGDTITTQTRAVQFDRALNYYNPNLYIVSHKHTPCLNDVKRQKRPLHLEAYLNQPKPKVAYAPATGQNLSEAEQNFKQKVGKHAPTKHMRDTAPLRAPDPRTSQFRRPGQPVFHTVGLEKPNPTKSQQAEADLRRQHLMIVRERVQQSNLPKRP